MSFVQSLKQYRAEQKGPLKNKAWKSFFPEEDYPEAAAEENKLKLFCTVFREAVTDASKTWARRAFVIEHGEIDTLLRKQKTTFETLFLENAERTYKTASVALTILCNEKTPEIKGAPAEEKIPGETRKISLQIINVLPSISFDEIKVKNLSRLVSICGTVVRVSSIRIETTKTTFVCTKCLEKCVVHYKTPKMIPPKKCPTPRCTSRQFQQEEQPAVVGYRPVQEITLQEVFDSVHGGGRIPRTMVVALGEENIANTVPGDIVWVAGVIETQDAHETFACTKTQELRLQAFSLVNSAVTEERGETKETEKTFSAEEISVMEQLPKKENTLGTLVASFSPGIFGHELVKMGMLLALFGGTSRHKIDGKPAVRAESHILMVGDPGIGKSQLLLSASHIAPRSVYVCGNGASTAGLTVTVNSSGHGEYAIEAGALVLGDKGVCLIDEFDKMNDERHCSLLEAMEQQSVSVAKAGIACTLPARTAVIAAANPAKGDYSAARKGKDVLRLNRALLSRFDLVFFMRDKPCAKHDKTLSEHIINRRRGINKKHKLEDTLTQKNTEAGTLVAKIKKNTDTIDPCLLKKYISYSRQKAHPEMTKEAADVLLEHYLQMRANVRYGAVLPVTIRQLESLIRLTEARAKMELRTKVTEQDARDIVELATKCEEDSFVGGLETEEGKKKTTKTKQRQKVIAFLRHENARGKIEHRREDIVRMAGVDEHVGQEAVEMLIECGALIMRGGGVLKFTDFC
ncbi:MAG: DNA replication licensing factor Mcm8 [Amphiamblys sp. WSBS2006]|nr:MAG: DNA replication licensing factor Mcm8 [Amphiamblys sp. WSBS2006]